MTGAIRRLVAAGLLLGLLTAASAASELDEQAKWGQFRGQVVDLETGQPIVGAVMLVVWLEVYGFGFAGHRFYDAHEAVTDAEGRFEIPRLSVPPWKVGVQPPTFHLFAPGYEPYADVITPVSGRVFIDETVSQMRRLKTRQELLRKSRSTPSFVPHAKMREFVKAVNTERRMLGLQPIDPE